MEDGVDLRQLSQASWVKMGQDEQQNLICEPSQPSGPRAEGTRIRADRFGRGCHAVQQSLPQARMKYLELQVCKEFKKVESCRSIYHLGAKIPPFYLFFRNVKVKEIKTATTPRHTRQYIHFYLFYFILFSIVLKKKAQSRRRKYNGRRRKSIARIL